MLHAVTRQASLVEAKLSALNKHYLQEGKRQISMANWFDHLATESDLAVVVMEEDFLKAGRELVPSVSLGELEHYGRIRGVFEGVGKGKDEEKAVIDAQQQQLQNRPRSNGKGKTKTVDRKGKGKERAIRDPEEGGGVVEEEKDGDDGGGGGGWGRNGMGTVDKGKGKAVDMSFGRGTEEDDEGLY